MPAPLKPFLSAWRRIDARLAAAIGWLLAGALMALLLALAVLRAYVWPRLDAWREPIATVVGQHLGLELRIGALVPGTELWLPSLEVRDIVVTDAGRPALAVPLLRLRLSPRALWTLQPRFDLIELESPTVRVERRGPDLLRVAGFDVDLSRPGDGRALERLLGQQRVVVRAAHLAWAATPGAAARDIGPIDVGLDSAGRQHRIGFKVGALPGAWDGLHATGEFRRAPRVPASDWRRWTGEASVGVDGGRFAVLVPVVADRFPGALPAGVLPETGQVDLRGVLRADADGGREFGFRIAGRDAQWGPVSVTRPAVGAFEAEGRYTLAAGRRTLVLDAARLRASSGLDLVSEGPLRAVFDDEGRPMRLEGGLRPFDLAGALALARRAPLPEAWTQALAGTVGAGRVAALGVRWARQSEPAGPLGERLAGDIEAWAELDRVSLRLPAHEEQGAAAPGWPWFANLSGRARLDGRALELRVASRAVVVGFPGLFADPAIGLDELDAEMRLRFDEPGPGPGPVLEIASARFANADAAGTVSGRWRGGGRGAGVVDVTGRLERGEGNRVWRYLPGLIPDMVREWVRTGVVAGRIDDARFALRGDLADFPFLKPAEGEFVVDARLTDAILDYAEGWPRIEALQGRLRFERNGLQVAVRAGRALGVELGPTVAAIRDYEESVLRIEGGGGGSAAEMLRFVDQSPLAARFDDFIRDATLEGDARLQLRLEVPLYELDNTRVDGSVTLAGNTLRLDEGIPPFTDLAGRLEFTERLLALRGVTARLVGSPLRVEGETPEPGRFLLRAGGSIEAAAMRELVDNPLTRRMAGQTDWRAEVDLTGRAVSMQLESDLRGLGVAMPPPFDKPSGQALPLTVRVAAHAPVDVRSMSPGDAIRVDLGPTMRLALERERDLASGRLRIARGAFAIDAEPVLPDSGLALLLDTAEIDLDAWMPLLTGAELRDASERAAEEFAPGFSLLPSTIAAVADRLLVGGKQFNKVVIGATRSEGYWRANVVSREVDGYFSWRDAAPGQPIGTLAARFNRLEIPRARTGEYEALLDSSPEALPALDIVVDDFILNDRRIGSLSLRATNGGTAAAPAWRLDALDLRHGSAALRASGTWAPARPELPRSTRLDFELDVIDAGALLALYGVPEGVRGGAGRLSGALGWQGSPLAIDYASLSGTMRLQVGKGQFLKTEPGLAKLIGVLNLQALPRRLALDFRDVFAEGFAFDEIAGEVGVDAGVARTERFEMRGLQARVEISGEANLEHETQSLLVTVRPDLNTGMASLAYAAIANPAIGIGSIVLQSILRRPLQEIFSYRYRVSGSWADPHVVELTRGGAPEPEPGAPIR